VRKIVETSTLDWEEQDALKSILNVKYLPRLIIIETIEELEK